MLSVMGKDRQALGASSAQTIVVALVAAVAACAVGAAYLIPAWSGGSWDVAWTSAAVVGVAGMLLARRAATGRQRRRFTLWAVAAGFWLVGQLLWDLYGVIGFPQSPNLADVAWWAFAAVVTASLIFSDARSRSVRAVVTVETLTTMAAAVALTVGELWPDATASTLSTAPKISAIVYPSIYIVAAVVTLQAIIGGALRGYRRSVAGLVMGGLAAEAVAFGLWSPQLLAGTYVPGHTLIDPLFVLGLLMIGAGGALSARRVEIAPEATEPARSGGVVPGLMFVLLMAALVDANLRAAPGEVTLILRAGLFFAALAFIARGVLLERRLRELLGRERVARTALAEREAELARLNAQLVEDSRRDPLTGMRNRRALADDFLELEARRPDEGGFAVALCDVDHFKAYNDRLGHLAGDHALRTIAAIVRATLRAGDLSYRFGGEEILLVLRTAGTEEAQAVAERVRVAVQAAAIHHPAAPGGVVTISVGVAAGADETDRLLARADGALYDAKHGGATGPWSPRTPCPAAPGCARTSRADGPVPRHLRSMLAVSRAAASGQGPLPVLDALAETIRPSCPSTSSPSISSTAPARRCASSRCSGTTTHAPPCWAPPARCRSGSRARPRVRAPAAPSGCLPGPRTGATRSSTGPRPRAPSPAPTDGTPTTCSCSRCARQDGEILGAVSVDQPASGRRPTDEEIAYLMSVADHAAIGVEQSLRHGRGARRGCRAVLRAAARRGHAAGRGA